jgi:hypothetical protein
VSGEHIIGDIKMQKLTIILLLLLCIKAGHSQGRFDTFIKASVNDYIKREGNTTIDTYGYYVLKIVAYDTIKMKCAISLGNVMDIGPYDIIKPKYEILINDHIILIMTDLNLDADFEKIAIPRSYVLKDKFKKNNTWSGTVRIGIYNYSRWR